MKFFIISRGFAELQILKVIMALSLELKWNIVMKVCIHIDIDKMYPMRLSNDTWDWLSFCRGSKSEKSDTIAKRQILKKWKWPYLLNRVEYFDKLLRKHWYWQDLAQEIAKWHFHCSRLCQGPNSEKVKMVLSLELSGILWWNFAYTLILTRWTMRLSNDTWDWLSFCRGSNSEKRETIYHRSRLCRAPNSKKKVKMDLSL